MKFNSVLFFAILFSLPNCLSAQPWSGIIAPSRAVDWRNAGVPGGIPDASWPMCVTTQCNTLYATGTSASVAQLNAAIASAPSQSYVYLGPGTYNLVTGGNSIQMYNSNVVLRGAGANQTFLITGTGGTSCLGLAATICVNSNEISYPQNPANTANWTAGYSKGASSITLSNVSNLVANKSVILLDQCDSGLTGSLSSSTCTGTETDNGNYFVCQSVGVCSAQGSGGGSRGGRLQYQMVMVTSISGSGPYTVGISPGLYDGNWSSGQYPGAEWPTNEASNIGVENLSIDGSLQDNGSAVMLFNCYGCWVTGIRSINSDRNVVQFLQATHCTIANNYSYGTQNASDLSYGVENQVGSDNLVVNNIWEHLVSPITISAADEGSVYAYNFAIDDFFGASTGWFVAPYFVHNGGTGYDLWEGNIGQGFTADNIHGDHNLSTFLRNQFWGYQVDCNGVGCGVNTVPWDMQEFVRYFNYIGNVVGQPGYHNNYSSYPSSTTANPQSTNCLTSIYVIGYSGDLCSYSAGVGLNDIYAAPSAMMWGNYDVVTGAVRWCGNSSDPGWSTICSGKSEVPTGLTDGYGNPVPSSTILPNSFYYASQPSWWSTTWGTPPWPAIGPDVTGGNVTGLGGFANKTPAQVVYENSPVDPNYQHSYTITNITCSGGIATATIGANPISQGEIRITGVTPAGYNVSNGAQLISWIANSTVTYPIVGGTCPGAYSSGGTMTWPNIRLFNAANYGVSSVAPAPPTNLSAIPQ
jgi:hypothetical protein